MTTFRKKDLFTQAVRPGFKFRLRFFVFFVFFGFLVQSQIAVWSLKRMRQLCMCTTHGIYRTSNKLLIDSKK